MILISVCIYKFLCFLIRNKMYYLVELKFFFLDKDYIFNVN